MKKLCGYSKGHVKKLIRRWQSSTLRWNDKRNRNKFPVKYFAGDISLLIKTDKAHSCLNAVATKEILKREFEVFGKEEYATIAGISISHIYNIRNNNLQYESSGALVYKHTQATKVNIGVRKKPKPCGKPGYLRVDTVHQGDLDGVKGVYHINIVDEVTQFEMIATVEKISEKYLKPVIEELLELFPFVVYEFHSDNGSEYINTQVATMLNKIHVELTKSRSRHSNDNALVESKNGSIVRKLFGRNFIDQKHAPLIDEFNRKYVNGYLVYHRPCLFAENKVDRLGKVCKKYLCSMTPYEKLKSLPDAEKCLKPGITFVGLDKMAYAQSDNECAEELMKARDKLFEKIGK